MKISFIGHASILVETHGISILSDPWWRGPCFGAQWWIYPPPQTQPAENGVDYIYISHGHHDHLHPGTLRSLDRRAKCLISNGLGLGRTLSDLGFAFIAVDENGLELTPGVSVRIMETHAGDTLCAISDGDQVCVNLNDALHAAPAEIQDRFIAKLNVLYPRIDYLFCGYGVASHFPNCYRIPGKDDNATAARRQAYFNRQWVRLVRALRPRFAFPFAADVVLLEDDLMWANEPVHNAERPADVYRGVQSGSETTVVDIAPGFVIENAKIACDIRREKLSTPALKRDYAEQVKRANNYGNPTPAVFDEVLNLLAENVARCLRFLKEYRGDYRFLIKFRNSSDGIAIVRRHDEISVTATTELDKQRYDVTFVTRLQYLRSSLATPYGNEILFVGSGGIFDYRDRASVRRSLHRELATMLVRHPTCPPSRFGDNSPLSYRVKRGLKAILGKARPDLYDLENWTVWGRDVVTDE